MAKETPSVDKIYNDNNIKSEAMADYPLKNETYQVIGACMEVHKHLGHGFLEVVYQDAIEQEFNEQQIAFERERRYPVHYKETVLPHDFYADFVVFDQIILEVKAASSIVDEHIAQLLNYLRAAKVKVGLIVNFGRERLEWKRLVY